MAVAYVEGPALGEPDPTEWHSAWVGDEQDAWTSCTADSSDADLIEAARRGNERAWELIVERYQPLILGVARRHRLFGADAYDICQLTWTRLVENAHRLREPRALCGWIATTAARACLETIRLRRRAVSVDPTGNEGMDRTERFGGSADLDGVDVDEAMLRAERRAAVRASMSELNGTQRQLLLMLVADPPVPYAEISERMGVPMGSIGPTRARLLDKLRHSVAVRTLTAA